MKENTPESQTLRGELIPTAMGASRLCGHSGHRLAGKLLEQPQAVATELCAFSSMKPVRD